MKSISILFRISRPLLLIFAALLYTLGTGIAHYLGAALDGGLLLLGLLWVMIIQLGACFLIEYTAALMEAAAPPRSSRTEGEPAQPERLPPPTALAAAAACLTVAASLSVPLIRLLGWRSDIFLLMLLMFLGAFFYAAPPRRLANSGYGELALSVLLANFIPTFAFRLQSDESLRLVAMSTFPLWVLLLAMFVVIELSNYAADIKAARTTLLIRMGWERGMLLHNVLIFMAFILLGLAAVMGMPFAIALPTFLLIPVGFWQVRVMMRIAAGFKPNWNSLLLGAQVLVGVLTYLFAFGFWIR